MRSFWMVFSSASARLRSSRSTMLRMPTDCSWRKPRRLRSESAAQTRTLLERAVSSRSSAADAHPRLERIAAECGDDREDGREHRQTDQQRDHEAGVRKAC